MATATLRLVTIVMTHLNALKTKAIHSTVIVAMMMSHHAIKKVQHVYVQQHRIVLKVSVAVSANALQQLGKTFMPYDTYFMCHLLFLIFPNAI